MSNSFFNHVAQLIQSPPMTATITEAIFTTTLPTTTASSSAFDQLAIVSTARMNFTRPTEISLPASFGFVALILATVLGNTLVLLALYLDKRLHSPSFYLIANMAIADLLLGKSHFASSFDTIFPFRFIRPTVLIRLRIIRWPMDIR